MNIGYFMFECWVSFKKNVKLGYRKVYFLIITTNLKQIFSEFDVFEIYYCSEKLLKCMYLFSSVPYSLNYKKNYKLINVVNCN